MCYFHGHRFFNESRNRTFLRRFQYMGMPILLFPTNRHKKFTRMDRSRINPHARSHSLSISCNQLRSRQLCQGR